MDIFGKLNDLSQVFDKQLVRILANTVGNESSLFYWFHDYWENAADPRTKDYFMVSLSLSGIVAFFLTYIFLVTFAIPVFMRKRRPFNLHKAIIAYDVTMVLINMYFFFKVILVSNFGLALWNFSNPKTDTSSTALIFINTAYYYYLSKILDMLDTFFMAFRKKFSHISFLHVWHHISLPFAGWLFMKYNPYQPTISVIPIINTFIHVIMYGYYAIAALGPSYQKYLWWKKYITQIQLMQFVIVASWYTFVYFKQTDMPIGYILCNFGNALFLLALFSNFYRSSYQKAMSESKKVI